MSADEEAVDTDILILGLLYVGEPLGGERRPLQGSAARGGISASTLIRQESLEELTLGSCHRGRGYSSSRSYTLMVRQRQ